MTELNTNWRVKDESHITHIVEGDDENIIALIRIPRDDTNRDDWKERLLARATLAAAAPELRKSLQAAVHALRSYQYGNASPDLAGAVVAHCQKVLNAAEYKPPREPYDGGEQGTRGALP